MSRMQASASGSLRRINATRTESAGGGPRAEPGRGQGNPIFRFRAVGYRNAKGPDSLDDQSRGVPGAVGCHIQVDTHIDGRDGVQKPPRPLQSCIDERLGGFAFSAQKGRQGPGMVELEAELIMVGPCLGGEDAEGAPAVSPCRGEGP